MSVEMIGLYWHFVDIVWIIIFTVVYLIPTGEREHERSREPDSDSRSTSPTPPEASHAPARRAPEPEGVRPDRDRARRAITVAEVVDVLPRAAAPLLIVMLLGFTVIKFTIVVMWFMHLKFDERRYARFFVMGLALAVTLYLIVLLTSPASSLHEVAMGALPPWHVHLDVSSSWAASWRCTCSRCAADAASLRPTHALAEAAEEGPTTRATAGRSAVLHGDGRAAGSARLADPRPRRAVPVQHAHGAAPAVHARRRADPDRPGRRPGCCARSCGRAGRSARVGSDATGRRARASSTACCCSRTGRRSWTRRSAPSSRTSRCTCCSWLGDRDVVAGRVAAAGAAGADPAGADALPVPPVAGADDPRVVPDVRHASRSTRSTSRSRGSGGSARSTTSSSPG